MDKDTVDPLLLQREAINPYRFSAAEILRRLRWDITPESWRSRRLLCNWKNRYSGGKAIILCNGPSLLETDFDLLDGIFTFGLNKINLLFDKTAFRPSCIVSVNSLVIDQNADFFNETQIPLFFDSGARQCILRRSNVAFLHSTEQKKFARDCSVSIHQGHTVTFVAMQLAAHMGFREIGLVGCDHNFATKGPANLTVTSGAHDPNHFDPNYFADGMKWQLPDLVQSEIGYMLAGQVFGAMGGRIVNCTAGGKLEIFSRMSLEGFLGSDANETQKK